MANVSPPVAAPSDSPPVYLVDTPALARYLGGDIPRDLEPLFDAAEKGKATLLLHDQVLAEFLTACANGRLKVDHPGVVIEQLLKELEASPVFTLASMDYGGWQTFFHTEVRQPVERFLVALARSHDAKAILTNNPVLKKAYPCVW